MESNGGMNQVLAPVVPDVVDLEPESSSTWVWHGHRDGAPVRVVIIDEQFVRPVASDVVLEAIVRLQRATQHQFSVHVVDCHRIEPGVIAIVTDHHRLGSLQRVIEMTGPANWEEVAILGSEIAQALQFSHDHGVVHGHVGPDTVLLGNDHHARLGGHGALSEVEGLVDPAHQNPGVRPPEGVPSVAGDLYSLAATLMFALAGPGWRDHSMADDGGVGELLAPLLSATPSDRSLTAEQVSSALRRLLDRRSTAAAAPAVELMPARKDSLAVRRRWPALVGIVIAATGLAAGALALRSGDSPVIDNTPPPSITTIPIPTVTLAKPPTLTSLEPVPTVAPTTSVVPLTTTVAPTTSVNQTTVATTASSVAANPTTRRTVTTQPISTVTTAKPTTTIPRDTEPPPVP